MLTDSYYGAKGWITDIPKQHLNHAHFNRYELSRCSHPFLGIRCNLEFEHGWDTSEDEFGNENFTYNMEKAWHASISSNGVIAAVWCDRAYMKMEKEDNYFV